MKLAVVGLGYCGGQIADEFARIQMRARGLRGIDIVSEVLAVNTAMADLAALTSIKSDSSHRLLIGSEQTRGHGTDRDSELGMEIMQAEARRLLDVLKSNSRVKEADAVLVAASAAGGTSSGGLAVLVRAIKERIVDKPIYAMLVLPFENEENNEFSAVFNTSACLQSIGPVADAVILVDNQRFVSTEEPLHLTLQRINRAAVLPFYNLLSCGEDHKARSQQPLKTADVIFALDGWSVVGYGESTMPVITAKSQQGVFLHRDLYADQGMHAMNAALNGLTFPCKPQSARKALSLLTASGKELGAGLTRALNEYMIHIAPNAQLRHGDYSRDKILEVSVILSHFGYDERLNHFNAKAIQLLEEHETRQTLKPDIAMLTEEFGKNIPTLL
ncbi:MAG: cell division protein FtsZ [Dehalococcoidia bacterium]|nr:cell division protein FtsZ [Dehalococcoidia bacterium]